MQSIADRPAALRSRLDLRARHLELLHAARIPVPDPDEPEPSPIILDPAECVHPLAGCRYDGLMLGFDEVRAQLTCFACGSSVTVPVREDVAAEHGGGGSRARHGPAAASGMGPTVQEG